MSAIARIVLSACALVGAAWFASHAGNDIRRDEALWSHGVLAEASHVSGRETSHFFIINTYDLDTTYDDRAGEQHLGHASFDLLFASIPDGAPVSLKFDPEHPTRHVVSWAIEHTRARWAFVAFIALVVGGLFGGTLLVTALRTLRTLADARRVAARSDEVALELVSARSIRAGRRHVNDVYVFTHTVHGRSVQGKQVLAPKEQPMFTDEKKTHLVALVSPDAPERPWIMRADKAPFENA